ncbi:MAG: hypothetical protein KGN76_07975 [Acidobacteriota bacterium]|nr:hypothetical protein [Acidobacteriota bacterium]
MRGRHLSEERLIEYYLQQRGTSAADPVWGAVASAHLATCEPCARLYAETAGFLDAVRDETTLHDASVFSEGRLAAQHDRILRRVDPEGRTGHVLSFPGRRMVRRIERATGFTRRWVAAAAVAGLVAGLLLGRVVDRSFWPAPAGLTASASTPAASLMASQAPAVRPAAHAPDDGFVSVDLSDLDTLGADHTVVLQAYDALTPRVQEEGLSASR